MIDEEVTALAQALIDAGTQIGKAERRADDTFLAKIVLERDMQAQIDKLNSDLIRMHRQLVECRAARNEQRDERIEVGHE